VLEIGEEHKPMLTKAALIEIDDRGVTERIAVPYNPPAYKPGTDDDAHDEELGWYDANLMKTALIQYRGRWPTSRVRGVRITLTASVSILEPDYQEE
jgi:hypothetical protein